MMLLNVIGDNDNDSWIEYEMIVNVLKHWFIQVDVINMIQSFVVIFRQIYWFQSIQLS